MLYDINILNCNSVLRLSCLCLCMCVRVCACVYVRVYGSVWVCACVILKVVLWVYNMNPPLVVCVLPDGLNVRERPGSVFQSLRGAVSLSAVRASSYDLTANTFLCWNSPLHGFHVKTKYLMFTLTNPHPFELIYCQERKKYINANSHVRLFIGFWLLLPFYYLHTKEELSISLRVPFHSIDAAVLRCYSTLASLKPGTLR